jgi:RNA polymerase sigma-70 factor (ECF subfamily)
VASSESSNRAGDDSPLVRAFLDKRQNLVLFLAARTRSMSLAEDLVQDLYVKVAALDPGAEVRAPGPLLYRMAANLMVDQARSQQRALRRENQWRDDTRPTLGGEDVVDEPAADQAMVSRERTRQLAEAVAALPPQMGRAFRLNKLEGLTQAQTADAMGVSRKMVEQHIQAAMKALTRRLAP